MKVYLVGGAVRDELLGIANAQTEKDYVVVGSCVGEMLALGYRQVGKDFPVFLHPKTHAEYALARIERKTGKGYQGFEFNSANNVTLEQDLSRRDLTINAIAKDEATATIIDPFNGVADLKNKKLKHVADAFVEDPVRVLRTARFAARFNRYGFKLATETADLMQKITASGELDALVPERIFLELDKALSTNNPQVFLQTLLDCKAIFRVFPMLDDKTLMRDNGILSNIDADNAVKFAIWLSFFNVSDVKKACNFLKCPKKYTQLALLSAQYINFVKSFNTQQDIAIVDFFSRTDAIRRVDRFNDLLSVFSVLGVNTKVILKLQQKLASIDVSSLDSGDIAQAIYNKKLSIVRSFISPARTK